MNSLRGFTRRDGVFGGVLGGLAHCLNIPAFAIRIAFCVSIVFTGGLSVVLYMCAVFAFPNEFQIKAFGEGPKIFGVCFRLAPKLSLSPGWARFFTLALCVFTGFFPVFALYLVAHLVLNENDHKNNGGDNSRGGSRNYDPRSYQSGRFRDVN